MEDLTREQRWPAMKPDRHFWAFYYYCKRKGDDVRIEHVGNGLAIFIRKGGKK